MWQTVAGPWGGWLVVGLWVVVLATMVYWIVKTAERNGVGHMHQGGDTALDILKKRYARGEITKEELVRMKKNVRG